MTRVAVAPSEASHVVEAVRRGGGEVVPLAEAPARLAYRGEKDMAALALSRLA